jgi:hypothetical protein
MKKILVSLPEGVFGLVQGLKGEIGDSNSEVVRNIVVAYLSEQGYFSTMGPIKGIPSSERRKAHESKRK